MNEVNENEEKNQLNWIIIFWRFYIKKVSNKNLTGPPGGPFGPFSPFTNCTGSLTRSKTSGRK